MVTGLVKNPSPSSLRMDPSLTASICTLGTAIFWLIGQLVHRATSVAAEIVLDAGDELHLARGRRFHLLCLPVALAVLVVISLIVIEAIVEKNGIVNAATTASVAFQLGKASGAKPASIAFWAIAFIVSVPFVLFHAYEGWIEVRHRIARLRLDGLVAKATEERLDCPELKAVSAAIGAVREAERSLSTCPEVDSSPGVQEANRRLLEIERLCQEHPDILRARAFQEGKAEKLEADLMVRHAAAAVQAARAAMESAPILNPGRQHRDASGDESTVGAEVADAERRLTLVRDRLASDPQVAVTRDRLQRTRDDLSALDQKVAEETARFDRRRKRIYYAPDRYMKSWIQDGRDDWLAAQILFDREYHRVMRLVECPWYLRWLERLRMYFSQDEVARMALRTVPGEKPLKRRLTYTAVGAGAVMAFVLAAIQLFAH
jgi:hypothetical protein